jgi:methyl-accepting chemotaxis protein
MIPKMKIQTKVTLYTALLIGAMSGCLIAAVHYEVSRSYYGHIQEELENHLRVAEDQLDRLGKPLRINGGMLMAGNTVLNGDQAFVDRISALVGGNATVFQGDTRIATNIRLPDGSRATGTKLVGPAQRAVFTRGENFRGNITILGEPHLTAYDVLRNADGDVIGALQVSASKRVYSRALNSILLRSFMISFVGIFLVGFLVNLSLRKLTCALEIVDKSANSRQEL